MGRKKKKASKPWCWYPFKKRIEIFFRFDVVYVITFGLLFSVVVVRKMITEHHEIRLFTQWSKVIFP